MRCTILILPIIAVAAWSQENNPTRPDVPPITVKVEMPPETLRSTLLKLAVPTMLGSLLTLLGVWLTARRNSAENTANRKHQFELEIAKDRLAADGKSREKQLEFRRAIYADLISQTVGLSERQQRLRDCARDYAARHDPALLERFREITEKYADAVSKFLGTFSLAPLAVADSVHRLADRLNIPEIEITDPNAEQRFENSILVLERYLRALQDAGREEVWGITEPKSNGSGGEKT